MEVVPNVLEHNALNIVVLDRSAFYPTSGGQEHDTGRLRVGKQEFVVRDVLKVGPAVLHVLDKPLVGKANAADWKGDVVHGQVRFD